MNTNAFNLIYIPWVLGGKLDKRKKPQFGKYLQANRNFHKASVGLNFI
jgi:hypothetical protein